MPKEGVASVDEIALTRFRDEQAAIERFLAGIVAGKQGGPVRVPFVREIEAALLHPAFEIVGRDFVRRVQQRMIRRENANLRTFVSDAVARNLEGERADLFGFQIGGRVVLHDNHAAGFDVTEQFCLPCRDPVLGVVSADPENHGVKTFEIFGRDLRAAEHLHVVPDLLQALRNVVARARDVANQVPFLFDIGADDSRLGRRHQNVDANVLIGNAFARERVILAVHLDDRPKRSLPRIRRGMNGKCRERFGLGRFHFHRNGSRFDPPAFWRFEPELAADRARRSRDAYLDRLRFVVAEDED